MAKRLYKVCSTNKLDILKYAKQVGMKCYPRQVGVLVEKKVSGDSSPKDRALAPMKRTSTTVFCCGKKLGRRRSKRGRVKVKRWSPTHKLRAHRARASRRSSPLAHCARRCKGKTRRAFKKCMSVCLTK